MKIKKAVKRAKKVWVISWIIAISLAYFVFLTWNKLSELIGDSNILWMILAGIFLILVLVGWFNLKKGLEKFT